MLTDRVRFACLSDLFILENPRGRGAGSWLMEAIFAHDGLGNVQRRLLITRDGQDSYRPLAFEGVPPGSSCCAAPAPGRTIS